MKFKYLLYTVLAIFIISNVYLLIKLIKTEQTLEYITEKYTLLSIKEERSSFHLKNNANIQHRMEQIPLPEVSIKNVKNKEDITLKTLCKEDSILVFFRFKETHCDACIQSTLNLLKKFLSEHEIFNIIILSGYANIRQFSAFAQSQSNKMKVYNVENIPWQVDEIDEPYFFVVTKGKYVNNVFIPLKEDNIYTENYINMLLNKYRGIKVKKASY